MPAARLAPALLLAACCVLAAATGKPTFIGRLLGKAPVEAGDPIPLAALNAALFWDRDGHRSLEPLKNAIRAGADVNALLPKGETPLEYVCFKDQEMHMHAPPILELLFDAHANPNTPNRQGRTPLMVAAATIDRYYQDYFDTLQSHGGDMNKADPNGWTPLHFAVYNAHYSVVPKLLALGADVNARTKSGKTALDFARENGFGYGDPRLESLLIERGATY